MAGKPWERIKEKENTGESGSDWRFGVPTPELLDVSAGMPPVAPEIWPLRCLKPLELAFAGRGVHAKGFTGGGAEKVV